MRKFAVALLALVIMSAASAAETWGPPTGHTMVDVRTYSDGSFVFRFTPALAAGCQYNDHAGTPTTNAAVHKMVSALGVTAFSSEKKVQLIYDGCTSIGAVNVVGIIVLR